MLRSFRYVLFPISLLYGGVIWLRNRLFDRNVLRSTSFNFPIICIGNLVIGGSGKTPMTEYLVRLLRKDYRTATLSRGYKRKTEGFAMANEFTTALEIGDEPMQIHCKFPDITVVVGEKRLEAIPQLLQERPNTQVIILDDAFQHRQIRAGLNILLTAYNNLYTRDLMMPAGDLRDVRMSNKRADIIIVTKCPETLHDDERQAIIKEIGPLPGQAVYFTALQYGTPYHLFTRQPMKIKSEMDTLLICGIANPRPLKEYLTTQVNTYDMLRYADHHIFDIDDLADIRKHFDRMRSASKIMLTTEKDAVRLQKFEREMKDLPVYVIPIEHVFMFGDTETFSKSIRDFIDHFYKQH